MTYHQTKTALTQVTQFFLGRLPVKKGALVPELQIQSNNNSPPEVHSLLKDSYIVGRDPSSCDIVIKNQIVSKTHFSITRDPHNPYCFKIQDQNSSNGTFIGSQKITSHRLSHGDIVTLGTPESPEAVKLKFHNPSPIYLKTIHYSLYTIATFSSLALLWLVGYEWPKIPIGNILKSPLIISREEPPPNQFTPKNNIELNKLSDFSPYIPLALLSAEDSRFYWHLGIDPIGTLRAIKINLINQKPLQGGSGITQQLARSIFPDYVGGQTHSIDRKIREAIASIKLETFYSKNQILVIYMNRVYLGGQIQGFEQASQHYFGKPASKLNLPQSALLVALLPAPNRYNPCINERLARQQRNIVIGRMLDLGHITSRQAQDARRTPINDGFSSNTCPN